MPSPMPPLSPPSCHPQPLTYNPHPHQADYPVQVYFYKGSTLVHQVSGIRGEVLPVFSVADGAELEANFGHSEYAFMPSGFQGLIRVVSML
jgi:hypothetical protein